MGFQGEVGCYALQGGDDHLHHDLLHGRHQIDATHADQIGLHKRQCVFPGGAGEINQGV